MRIGILGTSHISPRAILEPAQLLPDVTVAAIASRDSSRAKAFAAKYNIPAAYGSYEALLADTTLDAVYIPLPPSLHAEWTIAALEAGHHVLCEKPLAANAVQARAMVATARQQSRSLLEGFHWRYHPFAARSIELCRDLGILRWGESRFDLMARPSSISRRFDLAGGALISHGCYAVHWLRTLSGEEPTVIRAAATLGSADLDLAMDASVEFPSGLRAQIRTDMTSSLELPFAAYLLLEGSLGDFRLLNPTGRDIGRRLTRRLINGQITNETCAPASSYFYQLQALLDAVNGRQDPLTGGIDSIRNMEAIDAIYDAAGLPVRS